MSNVDERRYLEVVSVSNDDKCIPVGHAAKIEMEVAKKLFNSAVVREAISSGTIYLREDVYNNFIPNLLPADSNAACAHHKEGKAVRQYLKVVSVSNDDKRIPTGNTSKVSVSTAKQMFDADMVAEAMKSGILYLKEDTYKSVVTSLIPSKTGITYVYHEDRELLTVYSKDGITEFCDDRGIDIKDFNFLVEIAPTVKSCESMFSGCESFNRQVYIPESVENCRLMFNDCRSLNSAVIIGNSVTNCSSMFYACKSFNQNVVIPNSVRNCRNMFTGCKSLSKKIVIPDLVTEHEDMFFCCPLMNNDGTPKTSQANNNAGAETHLFG